MGIEFLKCMLHTLECVLYTPQKTKKTALKIRQFFELFFDGLLIFNGSAPLA